jgi:predicted ATP-dependent endonuclease of OLD family
MIHSLRLRNLRSFSDDENSPYVDLKPITVFVGKNSSGKSSFLRTFPLIRQSVEAKTTGPILWYGSYVDFGAFSEAKKHECENETIFFDFKLSVDMGRSIRKRNYFYFRKIETESLDLKVEVGVTESDNKTIAKCLKLIIGDTVCFFKFEKGMKCSLSINDEEITFPNTLNHLNLNHFLPILGAFESIERGVKSQTKTFNEDFLEEFFSKKLEKELRKYFHHNTSLSTITSGVSRLGVIKRENIESSLRAVFKGNSTFIRNLAKRTEHICSLSYELIIYKELSNIIRSASSEIESTFKNVRYIAPLRATAERYYRHQDLQIEEIDHTGSNLAMLLRSFSLIENQKFTNWTKDNFGFSVRVEELGLHYALKIQTENDAKEYNINDMGFGFSQILPIVASIWMETSSNSRKTRRNSNKQLIFTIEQPELHLHPEYQAKLSRMFASAINTAKESGIDLIILFETHSKTMIDTLGDCIEDNVLTNEDVNIVLFEKNIDISSSQIRFSNFSKDGYLEKWPVGFFSGR